LLTVSTRYVNKVVDVNKELGKYKFILYEFLTYSNNAVLAAMVNNIEWYIQLFSNEATEPTDETESSLSEESKDIIIIEPKTSIRPNKGEFLFAFL
jgi:uncharacterized membrane protein